MGSRTPRCDAREFAAIELKPSSRVVYAELARELETELAEARTDADHWKSECNALQRMVHEARAEIAELKQELRDNSTLAARQIVPAECAVDELKERVIELESLFELQHKRTMEADKLWQIAHNKPDVWPDLGALIEWLIQRGDKSSDKKFSAEDI